MCTELLDVGLSALGRLSGELVGVFQQPPNRKAQSA